MAATWTRRLGALLIERRGSVGPLLTLMLVPIIGALGMATESSGWFFVQRAAQNAADAAVLAAASNGSATTAPTYIQEAQAVAVIYGFKNGTANATVTAINNATCPAPSTLTNCYQVTVTKKVPIALTTLIGYNGSTTIGDQKAVLVTATALASKPVPANACVVALGNTAGKKDDGFRLNGGASFNAKGCDLYSNVSATCNGHDGGFGTSFAFGDDNKGCGKAQMTAPSKYVDDVFSKVLPNNPQSGCPSKTLQAGVNDWSALPCVNLGTNPTLASGTATVLTNSTGTNKGTVVMVTGDLTVNGTISAAGGQGMSVVFTGASGAPGFIKGSGTIDFGAPTSGPWSGVALYQDPKLTTSSSQTYSGNSPAFNITGLIYTPYASLTFQGAINHQTGGYSCIGFIANNLLVSGTGSIFDNPVSQCYQAGLSNLPTSNTMAVRQALVQ